MKRPQILLQRKASPNALLEKELWMYAPCSQARAQARLATTANPSNPGVSVGIFFPAVAAVLLPAAAALQSQ